MAHLLDVNVLVALAWPRHVHHVAATQWFAQAHTQGWATTPVTESGFIRVSSNPRVFPDGASPAQAAEVLSRARAVAGHVFWPDTTSMADLVDLLEEHVHGSRAVTDAHLAMISASNDGLLVTFDVHAALLAQQLGADALLLEP